MSEIELLRLVEELRQRINRLESAQSIGPMAVWDDLPPNSVTVGGGASAPSFTAYNGNLRAYEFVGTGPTAKDIQMAWQLTHSWLEGSIIVPHIHLYVPNSGTGGNVRFYFEYTWVNVNGIEGATSTTLGTLSVPVGAGNQHKILELSGLVGVGKTLSSILSARLYRDPADPFDTFGASVWLKAADIHRQMDSLGSRQEYIK